MKRLLCTLGLAAAIAQAHGQSAVDSVVTLLAAGDVAACTGGELATAKLIDKVDGTIVVLGDAAYTSRRDTNTYLSCFDPSWGFFKERIRPVPGNHDLEPNMIKKYFAYFGKAAGEQPGGYYSFDYGRWHIIGLNSALDMGRRSKQGQWLSEVLAANKAKCTLAFMHHPRFSSGPHEKQWTTRAAYQTLDSAQVDVILAAHDHSYERFMPMDTDGKPADDAPRQFVVGTGGAGLYKLGRPEKGSEVRQDEWLGVLKLTLAPESYTWEFLAVEGSPFKDSGTGRCY